MHKHNDIEFMNMKHTRLRQARIDAGIPQTKAWSQLDLPGIRALRAYEWGAETPDDLTFQKMSELYGRSVSWLKE